MLQHSSRAKVKTLLEAFDMAAQQHPKARSASAEAAGGNGATAEGLPAGGKAQTPAAADGTVREGAGGVDAGGEAGGGGRTAVRKQHAFALMALALSNDKDKHEMHGGGDTSAGPCVDSESEGVRHQLCRLQLEVSLTLLPPQVLALRRACSMSSTPSLA